MLAEIYARLAIDPHSFHNPADRALLNIRRHPRASGNIYSRGQRDRSGLFCFHRLIETRAADPASLLWVPGPDPALFTIFSNIPGAFLLVDITRSLRLWDLEFFVITCPDGSVLFCCRSVRLLHICCTFAAIAAINRATKRCVFFDPVVFGRDRFSFAAIVELWRH